MVERSDKKSEITMINMLGFLMQNYTKMQEQIITTKRWKLSKIIKKWQKPENIR